MTASVSVRRQKIRKNHTKKRLFFFLLLTALLMFVVIFAEQICPYDPNAQVFTTLEPPSAAHPAGTDRMGRDLLSRILVGLQTSVISTLTLVVIITAAGTAVGVVCGHLGGVVDSLMMRVSDVCLAFPGLVFALAIAALLNGGLQNAIIALAVISWPKYARIARSQTLALESTDYIAAARLAGDTSAQIILRHILPNCAGPILVTAVLDIGTARPLEPHCGVPLLQGKPAENMDDKATVYPASALQKILCFFACSTAFHSTHWMEYW